MYLNSSGEFSTPESSGGVLEASGISPEGWGSAYRKSSGIRSTPEDSGICLNVRAIYLNILYRIAATVRIRNILNDVQLTLIVAEGFANLIVDLGGVKIPPRDFPQYLLNP